MVFLARRKPWNLPEASATPEQVYLDRRRFLAVAAIGACAGLAAPACGQGVEAEPEAGANTSPYADILLPGISRNPAFSSAGRPLTQEEIVYSYNNFYEFAYDKASVRHNAAGFKIEPYTLVIDGLVDRPLKLSLSDVEALGIEERVYRFRCVEAWAMTVPWLGVSLAALLRKAGIKNEARYAAFHSFLDPDQAPNQRRTEYNWPYYEGLRLDEALNELTFLATGLYGRRLLPQNGCPLRLIAPWKYGFKGPKSLVRIHLTDTQPPTLWSDVAPHEYTFLANVEPEVPHPRWSQRYERLIGTDEVVPTQLYNGYGEWAAPLYD